MEVSQLNTTIGIITIIVSMLGMYLAGKHYFFYRRLQEKLSMRIRFVFLTDALIYLVTLVFGLWAFFDWGFETAIALQIVRIPILLLNIVASVRLFVLYKDLSDKND